MNLRSELLYIFYCSPILTFTIAVQKKALNVQRFYQFWIF